jgi:hypothetical protein
MLSQVIIKVAGFDKQKRGRYYPRPSITGPERCIRQLVIWANGTPEDKAIADRFIVILDDSSFHEDLTADWLNLSAFKLHSSQMGVDVCELPFIRSPQPLPKKLIIDFSVLKDEDIDVLLQDAYKLGWRYCKICQKLVPMNMLHGHIDGIITDMLMIDRLWEHKALNHFRFEKLWAGEWPLDYFTQSGLYNNGLRRDIPKLTDSVLLIKNKNTSQYIDYVFPYDKKKDCISVTEIEHSSGEKKTATKEPLFIMKNVVKSAIDKFIEIHEHFQNKTLPDRPYEIGTVFPCNYCPWEKTCWKGYEKELKELATDTELPKETEDRIRYFLEKKGYKKEAEDEVDSLKASIKKILRENRTRKGRVGPYTVTLTLQKNDRIDKTKIPESYRKKATVKGYREILTIRKPKEEERS